MIVHVYSSKGLAYKALKEFVKFEGTKEVDRENLNLVSKGQLHAFRWRKGVEYPYTYVRASE